MSDDNKPQRISTIDHCTFSYADGKIRKKLGPYYIDGKRDDANRCFSFLVARAVMVKNDKGVEELKGLDQDILEECQFWVQGARFTLLSVDEVRKYYGQIPDLREKAAGG